MIAQLTTCTLIGNISDRMQFDIPGRMHAKSGMFVEVTGLSTCQPVYIGASQPPRLCTPSTALHWVVRTLRSEERKPSSRVFFLFRYMTKEGGLIAIGRDRTGACFPRLLPANSG